MSEMRGQKGPAADVRLQLQEQRILQQLGRSLLFGLHQLELQYVSLTLPLRLDPLAGRRAKPGHGRVLFHRGPFFLIGTPHDQRAG